MGGVEIIRGDTEEFMVLIEFVVVLSYLCVSVAQGIAFVCCCCWFFVVFVCGFVSNKINDRHEKI